MESGRKIESIANIAWKRFIENSETPFLETKKEKLKKVQKLRD